MKRVRELKTLEEKLVSPPALVLPLPKDLFIADTDAYYRVIGCVLLQHHEDGSMNSSDIGIEH